MARRKPISVRSLDLIFADEAGPLVGMTGEKLRKAWQRRAAIDALGGAPEPIIPSGPRRPAVWARRAWLEWLDLDLDPELRDVERIDLMTSEDLRIYLRLGASKDLYALLAPSQAGRSQRVVNLPTAIAPGIWSRFDVLEAVPESHLDLIR